ncbi:MAG: methyltransferase domain-containing protein [Desulfobacteraceae bacterium]|nr:methyltransferase domain-containing protein [Desulfobacteraceae bacterium]
MMSTNYKKVKEFYDQQIIKYGFDSPLALHWNSTEGQELRFAILAKIGDINNKSVLDIGCGVGDLYGFLNRQKVNPIYEGWDLSEEMIKGAQEKYPEAKFQTKNIHSAENSTLFDYVLASGLMSFPIDNHKDWVFKTIKKMFDLAKVGVGFNLLNSEYPDRDDTWHHADPKEIIDFCRELSPLLFIKKDYYEWDFTVFIYK